MKRMLLAGLAIAMLAGCQNQQRSQEAQEGQAAGGTGGTGGGAMQGQQAAGGSDSGRQMGQAQQQMAMGTITEVQEDQITVRTSDGEQMELTLDDSAQILMNGQPISRDRLQQGASVRAAYREQDGEMRVERLDVQSMGAGQQPGSEQPGMEQPGQPGGGMQGQQPSQQ